MTDGSTGVQEALSANAEAIEQAQAAVERLFEHRRSLFKRGREGGVSVTEMAAAARVHKSQVVRALG